jgi:hypothetical protein
LARALQICSNAQAKLSNRKFSYRDFAIRVLREAKRDIVLALDGLFGIPILMKPSAGIVMQYWNFAMTAY